jgi:hypothetical protein
LIIEVSGATTRFHLGATSTAHSRDEVQLRAYPLDENGDFWIEDEKGVKAKSCWESLRMSSAEATRQLHAAYEDICSWQNSFADELPQTLVAEVTFHVL